MTDRTDKDPGEEPAGEPADAGTIFTDYIDGLADGSGEDLDALCGRHRWSMVPLFIE